MIPISIITTAAISRIFFVKLIITVSDQLCDVRIDAF